MTILKSKIAFSIVWAALFLVTACTKSSTTSPSNSTNNNNNSNNNNSNTAPTLPGNVDVYFVGTLSGAYPNNNPLATYWKNDTAKTLAKSNSDLSEVSAIQVNNKDVYIAGSTPGGTFMVATLWINGVSQLLGSTSSASKASALAFNNGDIYAVGYARDSYGSLEATSWKNGVASIYVPANQEITSEANAIAVNGNDVYMAGYTFNSAYNSGNYDAVYWKNGVMTALTNNNGSMNNSLAYAMASNGTDIFIAGLDNGRATLWKNGVATYLDNSSVGSDAHAITISGNDIYVAGFVNEQPTFWKNGVETILPDAQPNSNHNIAIAVNGSDVFVASGIDKSGNSIFWINGKTAQINALATGLSSVYGMFAVPH